jgi:hypothetical protein
LRLASRLRAAQRAWPCAIWARQFRAISGNVGARMTVRAILFLGCGGFSSFIKSDEAILIEESKFKSHDH